MFNQRFKHAIVLFMLFFVLLFTSIKASGYYNKKQADLQNPQLITQEQKVDVSIDLNKKICDIPKPFLGFSQEWTWLGSFVSDKQVIQMIKRLSSYDTAPLVLRVGGSSSDKMNTVPDKSIWDTLNRINSELGMNFIITLNLGANDKELTKNQRLAAIENLPQDSIITFEIGNEPNYYSAQGYRPSNYLSYYPSELRDFCKYVMGSEKPVKVLAGPSWGHIYISADKLNWILNSSHEYIKYATTHFYKDTKETYNDPETLLDEEPLQKAMTYVKEQADTAKKHGAFLWISESNSISNGGRDGVSNVFSSALWMLDTSFEMIKNGAVGINYHQGSPTYSFFEKRKIEGTDKTAYFVQPCYYGMLMFQQAVKGNSKLLDKKIISDNADNSKIKIWPVVDEHELRIVVLNKDAKNEREVSINLNSEKSDKGRLIRLLSLSLAEKTDISLAGVTYSSLGGNPSGEYVEEIVSGISTEEKNKVYLIKMPAGSAAMLSIGLK